MRIICPIDDLISNSMVTVQFVYIEFFFLICIITILFGINVVIRLVIGGIFSKSYALVKYVFQYQSMEGPE